MPFLPCRWQSSLKLTDALALVSEANYDIRGKRQKSIKLEPNQDYQTRLDSPLLRTEGTPNQHRHVSKCM